MAQFGIFLYAMLSMFVITAMARNHREQRQSPEIITLVGWGLFSLSSTLFVLFTVLAVVIALGFPLPLGAVATLG